MRARTPSRSYVYLVSCVALYAFRQVVAWNAVGNASEIAMIKFVQEYRDIDEYRSANPNIFKIPFNSKNKYQVRDTLD